MTGYDLSSLSLRELQQLEAGVRIALGRARAKERAIVLQQMTLEASKHGFKLQDLFGAWRVKPRKPFIVDIQDVMAPSPAKYANPHNPAETWSGRGRRPRWLVKQLRRRGARLESFAAHHG